MNQPAEVASGIALLLRDVRNSTVGRHDEPPAFVVVLPPPALSNERLAVRFQDFLPHGQERAVEVGKAIRALIEQDRKAFEKHGTTASVCGGELFD